MPHHGRGRAESRGGSAGGIADGFTLQFDNADDKMQGKLALVWGRELCIGRGGERMRYRTRHAEKRLRRLGEHFKVVLVTGARQVGKSTLLRHVFPDMRAVVFDPVQDLYGARTPTSSSTVSRRR